MNQRKLAEARRLYHHVCHGGTLTPEDVSFMVVALEEAYERVEAHMSDCFRFNEPIRTPNHPDKAYVVITKDGDEIDVIRFGAQYEEREWVGLTDVEVGTLTVFDGLHDVETPLLADFVIAIEAKLKEKNT